MAPNKDGVKSGTSIVLVARDKISWVKELSESLMQEAHANSSNIKFCFRRLRLKNDNQDSPEYDLQIGERLIDTQRTSLINLNLPVGDYDRIEFDLERDCSGNSPKPSVSFTNQYGSFSTTSDIRIRFEGNFKVRTNAELELNIAPLLTALNQVKNSNSIRSTLENVSGSD